MEITQEMKEVLKEAQLQMREFVDWHHKFDGGCSIEFENATEQLEKVLTEIETH